MGRKPRLLHIFSTFKVGGPQMRFVALVPALAGEFSHEILAMDNNYAAGALLVGDTDVRLLRQDHAASLPLRLANYRQFIAKHEPDLMISYNWGAIEWSVANLFGVPHIHVVDGFGPEEATHRLGRRNLARRLLRATMSAVVVPSRTLQKIAETEWGISGRKLRFIPNGISAREQLSPSQRVSSLPQIAWAGAMRAEKNISRLLEAFAPLRGRAELVLVGDGPERSAVEAQVRAMSLQQAVRILGHREDVGAIFRQAQLVALSSDTEQMPLVVLEAMEAGRPVASVDVGDVRIMVSEANRAFVTGRSAPVLLDSLSALLANPDLCGQIGQANRRRLEMHYHIDRMVRSYRDLFREFIKFGR